MEYQELDFNNDNVSLEDAFGDMGIECNDTVTLHPDDVDDSNMSYFRS